MLAWMLAGVIAMTVMVFRSYKQGGMLHPVELCFALWCGPLYLTYVAVRWLYER